MTSRGCPSLPRALGRIPGGRGGRGGCARAEAAALRLVYCVEQFVQQSQPTISASSFNRLSLPSPLPSRGLVGTARVMDIDALLLHAACVTDTAVIDAITGTVLPLGGA